MSQLLALTTLDIVMICLAGLIFAGIVALIIILPCRLYLSALFSGAHIPVWTLISIKYAKLDTANIVAVYVNSKKAGLKLEIWDIVSHAKAGGNIDKLYSALLLAKQSKIGIHLDEIKAIEKSGEDVLEVVKSAINPVIYPFTNVIGMSKDNIELIVNGKITLKANLGRYLGGVNADTVVSRVSNEIINIINSSEYYNIVLENPALIATLLKGKKLAENSSFDILSIDIVNIRIGENHNLRNIRESAEKRKTEIEVQTERMKQSEIIAELQAKTRVQEEKIELVRQEQEFARKLYEAVEKGDLEALEYFKIKNLQADTEMRNLIAHPELSEKKPMMNPFFDDDDDDED